MAEETSRAEVQNTHSKEDPWEAKARDRTWLRCSPKHFLYHRSNTERETYTVTSPRPGTSANNPLPDQARPAPILRANPYPEVTDRICRLPLPTLIYQLEALNLGDLLRIWVRMGANPPRGPLPDFQGPSGISGHRCNCGALRGLLPISMRDDSREHERSYRKENSSQSSRRRLRVLLGYPDEPFRGPEEYGSATQFWNRNQIPFRSLLDPRLLLEAVSGILAKV